MHDIVIGAREKRQHRDHRGIDVYRIDGLEVVKSQSVERASGADANEQCATLVRRSRRWKVGQEAHVSLRKHRIAGVGHSIRNQSTNTGLDGSVDDHDGGRLLKSLVND